MKCNGCGLESERAEIFKTIHRAFDRGDLVFCPDCFEQRGRRSRSRLFWIYVLCGIVWVPVMLFPPFKFIGLLLLTIAFLQLCIFIFTLFHEIGHAIAGRTVGMRVFGINIGKGRVVHEFNLWGMFWRFRAIPFGGATISAAYSAHSFRVRKGLTVFGGPLANLIGLLISILLLPLEASLKPTFFNGFAPIRLCILSNLLLLFYNLWPRMVNSVSGMVPNDGLSLWKVWQLKDKQIEENLAARYWLESVESQKRKNLADAEKWIKEGLSRFPDNLSLKLHAADFLLDQRKYPEARRSYALLLGRDKKNVNLNGILLNNIAWIYLINGSPEFLSKAYTCSRIALEKLPWVVYCKGTRGCVLVERGEYEEGLKLLHDALKNHPEKSGKALNACYIGIAEARRENVAESRNYFAMARKLDPDCILLNREVSQQGTSKLS